MSTNSKSNNTVGNADGSTFYGSQMDMPFIERGILAEDIILPDLPPFPTWQEIHAGVAYYPYAIQLYKNVEGKFNIPILDPFDPTGVAEDTTVNSVKTKNIISDGSLQVSSYIDSNYVTLVIPKNILMNFEDIIPAGTIFFLAFIGGSTDADNIKVIGVDVNAGE